MDEDKILIRFIDLLNEGKVEQANAYLRKYRSFARNHEKTIKAIRLLRRLARRKPNFPAVGRVSKSGSCRTRTRRTSQTRRTSAL